MIYMRLTITIFVLSSIAASGAVFASGGFESRAMVQDQSSQVGAALLPEKPLSCDLEEPAAKRPTGRGDNFVTIINGCSHLAAFKLTITII